MKLFYAGSLEAILIFEFFSKAPELSMNNYFIFTFGFGFFKRQILRRTHRYHTDEEFFSMLKTNLSASLRFHEARSSATFDLQLDRNHSTTSPDATPPMKIICFQLLSVCGGSEIGVNVQQQHLLQPNNGKILSW